MKKTMMLAVLCALVATTAIAADNKAGDPCPVTGGISQAGFEGADVLSCVDGKWKKVGQVGTTPVSISVRLMEGDKLIESREVATLDGQRVQMWVGVQHHYAAQATKDETGKAVLTAGTLETGLGIALTPILTKDGKVTMEFTFDKSELTSLQTFKQDDLVIELPQVSAMTLNQKVVMKKGEEISIPFGELIRPKVIGAAHPQYLVKMIATVGKYQ